MPTSSEGTRGKRIQADRLHRSGGTSRCPRKRVNSNRNNIDCLSDLGSFLAAQRGFSGVEQRAFVLAYQVCSAFEPHEFVEQGYDTGGSTDPVDVARAYAEETFNAAAEAAGESGCLAAFHGEP